MDKKKKNKTHLYPDFNQFTLGLSTHGDWNQHDREKYHADGRERKAGVAILEKIDFKTSIVTRNKDRHYIMIITIVKQEERVVNIYVPNMGTPK